MKISTQAIKFINEHFGSAGDPAPNGVPELVEKIGAQLGAVEEATDFGARFDPVVIVKVVDVQDHPDADRLHVCKVDDGHVVENVERDENGHVQIVCGAPNVRVGMLAAWLPPGATVPSTFNTEPFVLEPRELRGQKSNGMLASAKELSLGDSHDGILEITLDGDEHIEPGTYFSDAYHLRGDTIIDIENKMFTHRPDCFGWLGVARELEGIQRRPYKSPEWYQMNPSMPGVEADELPLQVTNEIPHLVPRFVVIVVRDIQIKPSPVWLQVDLARVGLRSINNIVDYTNFFMLETGQPIHAYDYDKVKALAGDGTPTLTVRHPRQGEKIILLNGKEVEPRAEAMMVAVGEHLVCVGGAMGGADTEVDENTKNIIIEAANWNMYSMRKTSMAHGIFSDAVTRFTKGQSPLQNLAVVAKIVDEVRRFASGKVASPLIDINHVSPEAQERGNLHAPVTVGKDFVNSRLGWDLSTDDIAGLLQNVEFRVDKNNDELTITAPFWRTDIEIPEDIVEEVGRLYGFDHLPLVLPTRDITPAPKDAMIELKAHTRQTMSEAGANEVLSYSFVHGNLLDKVGQNRDLAFQLSNALSPELQYFRITLTPSLLERVHPNIKAGYDEFALFELNKIHLKGEQDPSEPDVPKEDNHLAFVFAANDKTAAASHAGAAYYAAKKYLNHVLPNVTPLLVPLESFDFRGDTWGEQMCAPYDPKRSAVIVKDSMAWGVVGEYKASVKKALKLPAYSAGFELALELLQDMPAKEYVQLPRFPKVEQDICLKVPTSTSYHAVHDFVWAHLDQHRPDATYYTLAPVDIYQRPDDPEHKQVTLRVGLASFERTLTDAEVAALLNRIADAAREQLQAERI